MRLYYLLYFGGMGAVSPFINLFYIQNHLSGTEIGLLGTLSALVGLISAPFLGRWNDNLRQPRLILQLALIINAAAYYFLSQQTVFLDMAIIIAFNALVTSCVNPQSQAQALVVVEEAGLGYGNIRMWGSLGYALAAVSSGWFIQRTSLLSGFYGFALLTVASAGILQLIRSPRKAGTQATVERSETIPMGRVLLEMVRNRELLAFLIALVVMWLATNGASNFEAVYLQELGANSSLIGWINMVGAMCEIPMMLGADSILRRRGSTFTLLAGFFSYSLSTALIVIHPSVASFFIYRIINGTSMGLYAVAFTYFIVERTPAKQTATMLALYSVTIAGVVGLVAAPLSGWVFDVAGAHWLYVMSLAGYVTAFAIIYLGVTRRPQPDQ